MTKQLIEYDYDGTTILVEVDEKATEEAEWEPVALLDHLPVIKAKLSFKNALNVIKPTAKAVMDQIDSLDVKPQSVEVGFGLAMKAQAGAVIAQMGAEANMNVKLMWDLQK